MRVRWTILAGAMYAIMIASTAGAQAPVPSPSQSSIGAHILLEGSAPGAAPFDDCTDGRCGNLTVIVRDARHAPIANSTVEINFGGCSDIAIASDQLFGASGQSYPAFKVVRGVTGPDGSFTFRIRGAATAAFTVSNTTSPGTNVGVTCATVCADGVTLGDLLVSAYDMDGHGSPQHAVNGADVALVASEVMKIALGGQARERDDYNGLGGVTGADASLAFEFDLDALLGTGSYDTGAAGGTPVTFPIMIDCRALADSAVRLRGCSGSSCFSSRQVQSLALVRGGYLLDACGGGCGIEPLIAFEVDSAGHVQYVPTLEPAVSGGGSTTLVVNSFVFPPRGDDIESSAAKFVIAIEPKFWSMMAGYPEFEVINGVHRLSSPMLFDRTTVVGRSDLLHHGDVADVGGAPVGVSGTMVADGDISFRPPGFEGAAGTPELHTEMHTLNLVDVSGVAVRAGTAAPDRPLSVGEIE